MRGPTAVRPRTPPASWPPVLPATPTVGPRRPRDRCCCTWPRCSSAARMTERVWTGLWTRTIRPWSKPRRLGAKAIDEVLAYAAWRTGIRRRPPRRPDCWARSARPTNCCIERQAGAAGPGRAESRPPAADGGPGGDRAVAADASRMPVPATCRRRWASSRPAAASAMRWSAARTWNKRAIWPACSPRPVFETDTATTGKELLRLATRSPDYELAWIDVSINHPRDRHALAAVAARPADGVAARGACGPSRLFRSGRTLAAASTRWPRRSPGRTTNRRCRWQLEQLAALAPREFVGFDVRQRQAAEALDLLAELSTVVEQALRPAARAGLGAGGSVQSRSCRQGGGRVGQLELRREPAGAGRTWPAASPSRWNCGRPRPRPSARTSRNMASCLTTEEIRAAIPPLQRERETGRRHATRVGV